MNKAEQYVPTFEINASKFYLNAKNGPVSITIIDHPDSRPWTECCVEICEPGAYTGTGYMISVFACEIHPSSEDQHLNGGFFAWEDARFPLQDWRNTNGRMFHALKLANTAVSENKHTAAFILSSEQQNIIRDMIEEKNK